MGNGRKLAAGSALVAAIAILADWTSGADIQADVLSRAEGAISASGARWAEIEIDGRNLTLKGRAPDESSRDAVKAVIKDTWGVRALTDATGVVPVAAPFVWKVSKPAPTVVMSGAVPNEIVRDALAEDARSFAGKRVEDGSDLGRGAPAGNWADAAKVALAQIAMLNYGEVVLSDTTMTVTGEAPSAAAAFKLRRALARGMPDGFTATADISTPKAEPVVPLASVEACQSEFDQRTRDQEGWFGADGPFIAADAFRRLDGIALIARQCGNFAIDIVGTTNETGDAKRDETIGRIQAMAIRDYLVASGASYASLNAVGRADSEPVITGEDEADPLMRGIAFTVRTKDGS